MSSSAQDDKPHTSKVCSGRVRLGAYAETENNIEATESSAKKHQESRPHGAKKADNSAFAETDSQCTWQGRRESCQAETALGPRFIWPPDSSAKSA
jgi:hypothetical protein